MNRSASDRGMLGLVMIALLVLANGASNSCQPVREEGSSPRASAPTSSPQRLSPAGEVALRGWVDAGSLPDLRWPNFSATAST